MWMEESFYRLLIPAGAAGANTLCSHSTRFLIRTLGITLGCEHNGRLSVGATDEQMCADVCRRVSPGARG